MYGKPYHKMPLSSWLTPGGNRDQKRELMKAEKYPMKSAIQKNLGGPLSEVFFSGLTPIQQDNIGYTPKMKGPGRDLWVSPSDILEGHVIITPPFTSHVRQALTHQGIMMLGADIEERANKKLQEEVEQLLLQKEKEMLLLMGSQIKEAVLADRHAQQLINDHILERAGSDLTKTYQEVLADTMAQALAEGKYLLEEAVEKTKAKMEEEMCQAINSRSDYLGKQFEFHLYWRENELFGMFENHLTKQWQTCTSAMSRAHSEFAAKMKTVIADIQGRHVTDMIIHSLDKSYEFHEEKILIEDSFEGWFVKYFDNDIVKRDFTILEKEDVIRKLEEKCERREDQLREVFRHFQKFINFALQEEPGQAEFLLNVEKEIREQKLTKRGDETEVQFIARTILEYIIKVIDETSKEAKFLLCEPEEELYTINNFRAKIMEQRKKCNLLKLVGEDNRTTLSGAEFRKKETKSVATMFEKHPSMLPVLSGALSTADYDKLQSLVSQTKL